MQCLARVRRQVQEACTASELKERGVSQRLDGFARDLQRSKDRSAILAPRVVPRRATDECARGVFLGAEARLVSSPTIPRSEPGLRTLYKVLRVDCRARGVARQARWTAGRSGAMQ